MTLAVSPLAKEYMYSMKTPSSERKRSTFANEPGILGQLIPENKIELKVDEAVLNERMKNFVPKKKELSGYLKRYAALVSSGASGAILN